MVLGWVDLLAMTAVVAQAVDAVVGLGDAARFFLPARYHPWRRGFRCPFPARPRRWRKVPAACGDRGRHWCVHAELLPLAVSTQVTGLLADGTPRPMMVMTVLCAVLTLISGAIPYLLKRKAAASSPT